MSDNDPPRHHHHHHHNPEITDQQIAETLVSILHSSTHNNTLNGVVHQLESKLGGVNLGHRMDFIRSQIHHFLLIQQHIIPTQQQQQQLVQPNFYAAPPNVSHFSPNFAVRPQDNYYGFRSPQPQFSPFPSQRQMQMPTPPQVLKPTPPVVKNPAPPAVVESAPTGKKRRGGPGGLNKLCGVSQQLQTIVGQPTMPRTEIVKALWAYIKKYNLQDPSNKRKIICNDELRLVFETDCTDMFKMNKLLAKHIFALDPTEQIAPDAKRLKAEEMESGSKTSDAAPTMIISEALATFFGSDEREMSEAEVLRQMSEYIKDNQLEEPLNPAAILCDAKLKDLLGCESISALGIPEMLARLHLSKKS